MPPFGQAKTADRHEGKYAAAAVPVSKHADDAIGSSGRRPLVPTLSGMDSYLSLDETIRFEVPEQTDATRLRERLRQHWACSLVSFENTWVVYVDLEPRDGDLGSLLRTAEAWVAETHLGAIRFHLDGRAYVLEAGEVLWPLAAA